MGQPYAADDFVLALTTHIPLEPKSLSRHNAGDGVGRAIAESHRDGGAHYWVPRTAWAHFPRAVERRVSQAPTGRSQGATLAVDYAGIFFLGPRHRNCARPPRVG